MHLNITPYQPKYEQSFIKAYIDAFAGDPWFETWQPEWVKARLDWVVQVPNFIGLLVLDGDQVVAAMLGYGTPFKQRLDFEIMEFFVHPSVQRKGVGKALLKELEIQLAERDMDVVHLLTASGSSAERFYHSCGFEVQSQLSFMSKSGA